MGAGGDGVDPSSSEISVAVIVPPYVVVLEGGRHWLRRTRTRTSHRPPAAFPQSFAWPPRLPVVRHRSTYGLGGRWFDPARLPTFLTRPLISSCKTSCVSSLIS